MLTRNKLINGIILATVVFSLLGWVKSCSVEKRLSEANRELSTLKAENNSLVIDNREMIAENKIAMHVMDSLMKQSNITYEKEIHNHWNTIYNGLIVSDTAYKFISDYLYQLGQ